MAQFDVHRNAGKYRDSIPYVVVVQSALYDEYARRLVVPLVRESVLGKSPNPRLNPSFKIGSTRVVLHPLETVSVDLKKLGKAVDSLTRDADRIIGALDELLTRAWG